MAAVEGLVEGGGTNIWNGLHRGLEALRTGTDIMRNSLGHIMLLTDGQTTDRLRTLPALEAYRNQWERLPGTRQSRSLGGSCAAAAPRVSMAAFNDRYGGCI